MVAVQPCMDQNPIKKSFLRNFLSVSKLSLQWPSVHSQKAIMVERESPFFCRGRDSLMSEFSWNETNIKFTLLNSFYSSFKDSSFVIYDLFSSFQDPTFFSKLTQNLTIYLLLTNFDAINSAKTLYFRLKLSQDRLHKNVRDFEFLNLVLWITC